MCTGLCIISSACTLQPVKSLQWHWECWSLVSLSMRYSFFERLLKSRTHVDLTLNGTSAIVFAKFWWLRSAEGFCRRKTPSLLSETFAYNELMRRCLWRWQFETLEPGVRPSSTPLARCRIKRRFSQTPQNSLWNKA